MARATRLTLASLAGVTLTAYAGLQVLGRVAGTTGAERRQRLPGDELVDSATIVTEHAIDVAGEPEEVWPWLTQLGWHLGGYYTPAWGDRLLFPGNWPSLDRLDPALVRDLRVGDLIPDGPPGTAFFRATATAANTAAKLVDNHRHAATSLEYRSRQRTPLDSPGRLA
jgi:hypothetical protein